MRSCFLIMFVLLAVSVSAVPSYVVFDLDLDYISVIAFPSYVYVEGSLTIINNGTVNWVFESNYVPMAVIHFDGDTSGMGWYDWPINLTLPPNQRVTIEVEGNSSSLAAGLHTAQAYLFYGPGYNQEAVGNIVHFSADQILSEMDDLDWSVQNYDIGTGQVLVRLTATNDSDYFWKRQFPFNTVLGLGLDGEIPQNPTNSDLHWEYVGAHNQKDYDLLYYADAPFTPGHHSLQAYAFTHDGLPEPVGEPILFYIQGSIAEDEILPIYAARISPNPLSEDSVLSLNCPRKARIDITVFNARGQLVIRKSIDAQQGLNQLRLDNLLNQELPSGVYLIRLISHQRIETIKVLRTK